MPLKAYCRADVPYTVDEDFKKFVAQEPCLFCGAWPHAGGANDPHHVRNRAWRETHRYDYALVPACRECHNRIGNLGTEEMLRASGLRITDLVLAVARLLERYFKRRAVRDDQPI